ncbi:hypothetical protein V1264_004653 [Littorina saxatilis]|uniref:Transposase n=1 Tax=Littorina saxatilis TaxID=31220 RepID=A0AAN9B2I7_9CAEN
MPPRTKLTTLDRGRALGWLQDGVSGREVSRRLGVSHSVIQWLHQRFQTTGSAVERPRSGRPRCTDRRDDRYLQLLALRNRTNTRRTLIGNFRAATNVTISRMTVTRRLREVRLHSRRTVVRPPLTPRHRRARMAFCRNHRRWNRQQWGRVLFTDESRFTLSSCDARIRAWRRPGERFIDACVQEHDRYGGGSVMVWAGFHLHGRTPLYHIRGNLTGVLYRDEIVRPQIIPTLQAMGAGAMLQDDNATPHRARVVQDVLQRQEIVRMNWPARSPDLAPIEYLWDIIGRRVRDNHPPPADVDQLFQFLQQEWTAIPQQMLQNHVNSMRSRIGECLAARGGHTHY